MALLAELQRADLTPAALARMLGIPQSTVTRWLSAETLPPLSTRLRVAQVLKSHLLRLLSLGFEADAILQAAQGHEEREAIAV